MKQILVKTRFLIKGSSSPERFSLHCVTNDIDDFKLKGSIINRFNAKREKTRDYLLLWHQK